MKRRMLLLMMVCLPMSALAHSYKVGPISIGHAWALPNPHGDGQVFMPMLNAGKERDELVAARTDAAAYVELRENNHYVDPALASFVLEPGKPFAMRPTSMHLRLVGLSKPLIKGERFHLVLDFLNAGEIDIEVHVADKAGD